MVRSGLIARLVARQEATRIGFSAQAVTQIASAVSEITRNVVQHAGSPGLFRVMELTDGCRVGLRIAVDDSGIGIKELDRAIVGASPGAGIPGSRKLMDEFEIRSSPNLGTVVRMVKWL